MVGKTLVAVVIQALFALLSLLPKKQTVAFLSRQSARPFDFVLLEPELQKCLPYYTFEWACVKKGGKLGLGLFLRQLYLVATSTLCLVDGYVPAVSIPKRHRSLCVQLWHASGAIKKFGYQCLDTPAGRTSADAQAFRMHKGYDYVIAGMQGAIPAFAEGFGVECEKIIPLGTPRLDYLIGSQFIDNRQNAIRAICKQLHMHETSSTTIILYAPTFRKANENPNWMQENIIELSHALVDRDVLILVAGHPLDEDALQQQLATKGAPVHFLQGATINALLLADIVISDYSSIALDVGLLGKPVFFYVPDIEEYRQSPGLTIDPVLQFPTLSFTDARDLARALRLQEKKDANVFGVFISRYAGNVKGTSIADISELLSDIIINKN